MTNCSLRMIVDRSVFEQRVRKPAEQALQFARQFVVQPLPDQLVFRVYPNQSYDGHPRVADEEVFPDETLGNGCFHGPWSVEEVVGFLWRHGKVPEWVDIAVESEDTCCTIIALRCCGRFTSQEELLYHRPGGCPPFSIKSPCFPPGLWSVEEQGKFDLHWRENRKLSDSLLCYGPIALIIAGFDALTRWFQRKHR